MEQRTLTERLEDARIWLIRNKPFFGYSIPRMEFKEVSAEQCPTMGIDCKGRVFYSAEFLNSMSDESTKGVICHELMHFVLGHHIRSKEFKYRKLANLAQDMLINDILINLEGMTVLPCIDTIDVRAKNIDDIGKGYYANPKTGKFTVITYKGTKVDIDVRGQCWEYIYDCLLSLLARDDMKNPQSSGGNNEGDILGNSFDEHIWADENLSEEEKRALEDAAKDMLTDGKTYDDKKKGRSPDGSSWLDRMVDDKLKPQINWKSELKRVIQAAEPYDYTYMKPNKRSYSIGAYLPSVLKEAFYVTLAMDVSGSVSDKEFGMFMAEFKGIIQSKSNIRVRTLYWSTEVDKDNDMIFRRSTINSLSTTLPSIKTTGGTNMSCIKPYLERNSTPRDKKNLDVMIYLTDGYIERNPDLWPSKDKIFIITASGSDAVVKKYGKVIRLNDRD